MPLYRIADLVVSMNQRFKETEEWYKPYLIEEDIKPDLTINASDQDIDYFVTNGVDITPPVSENIVFCEKFNILLSKYYGSFFHSSALLYKGKVYLFSADSGVGKSTLTRRICNLIPDAVVINDDKPSFRMIDGKCIVYGTPFAGGTSVQKNLRGELGGIIFIDRAEENSYMKISAAQAIVMIIKQVKLARRADVRDRLLSVFSSILQTYPVYQFRCTNTDEAAMKALDLLNEI